MAFMEPEQQQHMIEVAKTGGDVVSLGGVGVALMGWLPPITAAVSLVWVCMRIYDTYLGIKEKKANADKSKRN